MSKHQRNDFQPLYMQIDSKSWFRFGEIVPVNGEPLTLDMIQGRTGNAPKGGFEIVRVPYLNAALTKVCKEQGKLLAYLFQTKSYERNTVDKTNAEICAATGVSRSTIVRMIDALEEENLLIQLRRKIYVNPRMIHKGDYNMETAMFKEFDDIAREFKKGDYAPKKEEESEAPSDADN